jgi:hypothetical protein
MHLFYVYFPADLMRPSHASFACISQCSLLGPSHVPLCAFPGRPDWAIPWPFCMHYPAALMGPSQAPLHCFPAALIAAIPCTFFNYPRLIGAPRGCAAVLLLSFLSPHKVTVCLAIRRGHPRACIPVRGLSYAHMQPIVNASDFPVSCAMKFVSPASIFSSFFSSCSFFYLGWTSSPL